MARGRAFAVHGTAELAFTGGAAALLLGVSISLGAAAGAVLAALAFGLRGLRQRERDSVIGVVLAFGQGLGVLFLSLYDGRASNKFGLLTGSIVSVDSTNLVVLTTTALMVLATLALCYRPLLFFSTDPEVAAARGVPVRLLTPLFAVLVGLTTALAVPVVGAILVLAVMVTPGAAAAQVTSNPAKATALSVLFAESALLGGIVLSLGPRPADLGLRRTIVFGWYLLCRLIARMRRSRGGPPRAPEDPLQSQPWVQPLAGSAVAAAPPAAAARWAPLLSREATRRHAVADDADQRLCVGVGWSGRDTSRRLPPPQFGSHARSRRHGDATPTKHLLPNRGVTLVLFVGNGSRCGLSRSRVTPAAAAIAPRRRRSNILRTAARLLAATGALVVAGLVVPAIASAQTACEEMNRNNGPLTGPVHGRRDRGADPCCSGDRARPARHRRAAHLRRLSLTLRTGLSGAGRLVRPGLLGCALVLLAGTVTPATATCRYGHAASRCAGRRLRRAAGGSARRQPLAGAGRAGLPRWPGRGQRARAGPGGR